MNSPVVRSPAVAGVACCAFSALGYTAANICMRQLNALGTDAAWAAFNKELVTVLVLGPWLALRACWGKPTLPPPRALAMLVAVGLAVELAGNLPVQWAFGVVGLAIVIPAIFGVSLTMGAALGHFLLGERVSARAGLAIGLLVAAIVLLSLGAATANRSLCGAGVPPATEALAGGTPAPQFLLWGALGVAAASLAGAVYALLTVTIRRAVTTNVPPAAIAVTVTSVGVLTLGPISLCRLGAAGLWHTPPQQLGWMAAAGLLNLLAFLAIIKGLQLTTVVHANVLNASQVAMAAVAGWLVFREPLSPWLVLGVVLTIVGVVMMDHG